MAICKPQQLKMFNYFEQGKANTRIQSFQFLFVNSLFYALFLPSFIFLLSSKMSAFPAIKMWKLKEKININMRIYGSVNKTVW